MRTQRPCVNPFVDITSDKIELDAVDIVSIEWRMDDVIKLLATEMGVNAEALRKWRTRGGVPHRLRLPMLELAKAKRLKLTVAQLEWPKRGARQMVAA